MIYAPKPEHYQQNTYENFLSQNYKLYIDYQEPASPLQSAN
jgi:hypothetical protein